MTLWTRLFGGWRARAGSPGGGDGPRPGAVPPAGASAGVPDPVATVAGRALPPVRPLGTTPSGVVVQGFRAPADELVGWWYRLRAEHVSTGLWPVLLGPDLGDLCRSLVSEMAEGYDDAAELSRARSLAPADVAAMRARRDEAYGDAASDDATEPAASVPRRLQPGDARFTVADQDGIVALVPAAHGWEVPVVLGWDGGVNLDMEPVEHAVVLRDWSERFGAELVSLTGDQVLELLVHHPPTDPRQALAVAREQYAYCPDIVDQGAGSLTALAEEQVGARSWYFWWD